MVLSIFSIIPRLMTYNMSEKHKSKPFKSKMKTDHTDHRVELCLEFFWMSCFYSYTKGTMQGVVKKKNPIKAEKDQISTV